MMLLAAWYHGIFAVLFGFLCVLLIIVILLQRGRGGGLSGAFGGVGGAASTAFGSKTGDMLTWITVGMAVVFLFFAVLLNYVFRPPSTTIASPPAISAPAQLPTAPATSGPVSSVPSIPATDSSTEMPIEIPVPQAPATETPAAQTPAAETPATDATATEPASASGEASE